MKKLMTYAQVSEALGVKVNTLYAWVSQGRIPHVNLGPRVVRFDPDELATWVENHRKATDLLALSTVSK